MTGQRDRGGPGKSTFLAHGGIEDETVWFEAPQPSTGAIPLRALRPSMNMIGNAPSNRGTPTGRAGTQSVAALLVLYSALPRHSADSDMQSA